MKCSAVLLSAAFTLAFATGAAARDRIADAPHLRPINQASGALMMDAQQKSPTVRNLIYRLEASDLVAYVNLAPLAKGTPESGTRFVGSSKAQRFVLISIADDSTADRRIELLGRELQHAAEVAETRWVTSDARFQTLISMLGWRDASRARGYETPAANVTERHVRQDVRGLSITQR